MNVGELTIQGPIRVARTNAPAGAIRLQVKDLFNRPLLVVNTRAIQSAAGVAAAFFMVVLAPDRTFASDALISGKATAEMVCTRCHDTISLKPPRGTVGDGSAPAFVSIAQDPKMAPAALRKFLQFPHGRMDNVTLTTQEIDGLILYIKSFSLQAEPKQ